jgi:hypothetical protein
LPTLSIFNSLFYFCCPFRKLEAYATTKSTARTETWFPLSHSQVLGSVVQALDAAGFGVKSMAFAVTPDDVRFFGALQLQAEILPGVGLAIGVRNSTDKSMPIGFCCGQSVFVCDNLGFTSEVVITRKRIRDVCSLSKQR